MTNRQPARRTLRCTLGPARSRRRPIRAVLLLAVCLTLVGSAWAVTLPTLSVSDVTVASPADGTARATFVVALSEASSSEVTVRYRTADGSATAPGDYEPETGTLRFAPGETSQTVSVRVNASPVPVPEKVFYLQLFDASKATVARPQGTATIVNDLPAIAISDTFIAEPPPAEINQAVFTVTLSVPSTRTVTVPFTTADGSAVAGEDYEPVIGELVFRPGQASKTVTVVVKNDLISGPDAIFWLRLGSPENGQLARAAGQATIVDWDRIVSVNDTAVLQPDPGATTFASFDVLLSQPTSGSTQPAAGFPGSGAAAVDFTTADGSAVAGQDYTPVSGTIVFLPGESSKTVLVPVVNNGVPGVDKAFFLRLENARGARLARSMGTATIVASNQTVAIDDTSVTDTDTPDNVASFVVSLSTPGPQPVSVRYATADGTAVAGVDYTSQQGTVVFSPGELSARITVPLRPDTATHSPDIPETFFIDLLGADNARIARGRATAVIVDNRAFISVRETSVMADPVAHVEAVFSVSLREPSATPIRVDFTTVDGTATAPADYQASSGTVEIAAGETTATIAVPVAPHPGTGPDKRFSVRLSGATNGRVIDTRATATIITRGRGYALAAADGGVFTYGDARFFGSTGGMELNYPIVGMAATPTGQGYWLVAADGGVFSFGDASFFGSTGAITLNQPIVAMAPTPSGQGYWLVASDGGIFSFGDASFFGSTGAITLNRPIVGMAPTPSGEGYWLVASDGGIFTFGDARFFGSGARRVLSQPVVAMTATPSGKGYWLVAADGGVLAFGDAGFFGSASDQEEDTPVIGILRSPSGNGYWLVGSNGAVLSFGDARFFGSAGGAELNEPIVGVAGTP